MIKYLGSKRRLIPVLSELFCRSGAESMLDLFTGTTRVAQAMKSGGAQVTAVDTARYSEMFSRTWIETDAAAVDHDELASIIEDLNRCPPEPGYVTEMFCEQARFFQPQNGARIDAIRDRIARDWAGSPYEPILLTALLLAADRVDSTAGVQMAYIKRWAKRSFNDLCLTVPNLLPGSGIARRGNAIELAGSLGSFDLAYLDPPYNQHRYDANYHIWETIVAWDAPDAYGVARKRTDLRDGTTKSAFNSKRTMPDALAATIAAVDAEVVVVSYNDESWLTLDELTSMCSVHGAVVPLAFESTRYVGAKIGIHNPQGVPVGEVSHLRNHEWVIVAGDPPTVARMTAGFGAESAR